MATSVLVAHFGLGVGVGKTASPGGRFFLRFRCDGIVFTMRDRPETWVFAGHRDWKTTTPMAHPPAEVAAGGK